MYRKELWKIINVIKKDMIILLTTHYMEEASQLADIIGFINKGALFMSNTLDNILKITNKQH